MEPEFPAKIRRVRLGSPDLGVSSIRITSLQPAGQQIPTQEHIAMTSQACSQLGLMPAIPFAWSVLPQV